ncbi:MAG: hypothetical protein Q6K80_06205 [Thermostichus sp. DG_1_6_bins_120]
MSNPITVFHQGHIEQLGSPPKTVPTTDPLLCGELYRETSLGSPACLVSLATGTHSNGPTREGDAGWVLPPDGQICDTAYLGVSLR